jgi:DNA-binding NarL/FixJ family response regulator
LGIRLPTVKKHVMHILEKLGLQDRLQAGLYLARNAFLLKP